MKNPKVSLTQKLLTYKDSDFYPFHMPGHKRARLPFPNPWSIDITEIDGFDNLHHPEDILLELKERAAWLFQTKESFLLINGSTCGLLAAVSACVPRGGRLLMSRNCHKSVYHGIFLRQLQPVYLMPELTDFGVMGSLSPEKVREAITADPDIGAVLVVSPTYDGVVSDIQTIADISHSFDLPLIVDEAHGAHLPFAGEAFPASALSCGADVVVQSLHKTLPSFTQTAILHVNSSRVDAEKIRGFLGIYQSSSPSYLLMASMEQCISLLEQELYGASALNPDPELPETASNAAKRKVHTSQRASGMFQQLRERLDAFYAACADLNYLEVFTKEQESRGDCFLHDRSKILISGKRLGMSGQDLYDLLLRKYHLQMEMASGHYVLALTSLMDRQEGFLRLLSALKEIDHMAYSRLYDDSKTADIKSRNSFYHIPEQGMLLHEALEQKSRTVMLRDAGGAVSQEYIYLYPPGIPLLAPGEIIDKGLLSDLAELKKLGLEPEGLQDSTFTRINIVN